MEDEEEMLISEFWRQSRAKVKDEQIIKVEDIRFSIFARKRKIKLVKTYNEMRGEDKRVSAAIQ